MISFKFRHWGFFEGPVKGHAPNREKVEFYGSGVLKLQLVLNPCMWKKSMAISSLMNSDLSIITHPLTSLSLRLTMLPVEEILSDLIIAATTPSLVPHLLERGLHDHISIDNHMAGGATLTSFLVVALLIKSITVWDTLLLIFQTATTSPSLETLLNHHRPTFQLLLMVLISIGIQTPMQLIM